MRYSQRRIRQIRSVLARGTIVTLLGAMLAACGGKGTSISQMTPATGSSSSAAGATLTVLYSFPSGKGPNASAGGVVQAADGNLYGWGGQNDLFRLSLSGAETDEPITFGSALAQPGLPAALTGPLVLGPDGMLYDTVGCFGTAGNGDSVGAVFSSDLLVMPSSCTPTISKPVTRATFRRRWIWYRLRMACSISSMTTSVTEERSMD